MNNRVLAAQKRSPTGKSSTSPGEHTRLACCLTASRRKPRKTIFSDAQNTLPQPLPRKAKVLHYFQWNEQPGFGGTEKTAHREIQHQPGEHTRLACCLTASRRKPRKTIFSDAQNTLPQPLPRKAKPFRFSSPPRRIASIPLGFEKAEAEHPLLPSGIPPKTAKNPDL
jgi:hypothetical protein